MKKHAPTIAIVGLTALAGVSFLVTGDVLVASLLATLAVVVWSFSPSGLGTPSVREPKVSPAELKQYRREHPGATISDAIEHARSSS